MAEVPSPGTLFKLGDLFGIPPRVQRKIIAVGWVLFVSSHIAWVCGFLAWAGVDTPFAKANDFAQLQHAVNVSAKLTLAAEIRQQSSNLCRVSDPVVRDSVDRYLEQLQVEYQGITGQRYPLNNCPP